MLTEADLTTGGFNWDEWVDIFIAEYDKAAELWLNDGQGEIRNS